MRVLAVLLFCFGFCLAAEQKRVLVLLENMAVKETHSIYFNMLQRNGFTLTYKVADDPSILLKKYDEFLYENIIVFAPTVEEFGGALSAETMMDFVDGGGNLLVTAGSVTGDVLREIASESGFEVDEDGTYVIDHHNFDGDNDGGYHTRVVAAPENLVKSDIIVGAGKLPLLYQGTGLLTDPNNPLVIDILTGATTAYTHNPQLPIQDYPHTVGKSTVMIAGLQARNNARIVFSGSLEFFSDEFFQAEVQIGSGTPVPSGNSELAEALSLWCFKERGVLRVDGVQHAKVGESSPPEFYTIREMCQFYIDVKEKVNGEWVPYGAKDMQLEFVRIDPFVRATMEVSKGGLIGAQFKIPDVYGVYQFKVNYQRLGLTRISTATQVSVRPLRHNQYERFIISAYPYYASSFSMMFGVFVFSFVFLYHSDETKKKTE
jgi:oligosaccharyltransferase complex subunit beta